VNNLQKNLALIIALLFVIVLIWGVITIKEEGKLTRNSVEQATNGISKNIITDVGEVAQDSIKGTFDVLKDVAISKRNSSSSKDSDNKQIISEPDQNNKKDVVDNLFDIFNKTLKSADDIGQKILGFTLEDEIALGKDVHKQIAKEIKFVDDEKLIDKIRLLSSSILEIRDRKDISYKFFIVKSDEINAFSHVGGYVYINQGLIDYFVSDPELQFVIGHEIAHVDLKHCTKKIAYAARARQVGGNVAESMTAIAYSTISLGYSKDDEFEADEKAFQWLIKNKFSREKALLGVRKLVLLSDNIDQNRIPGNVKSNDILNKIDEHFASHPPASERLIRLEKFKY
jgi:hypothetical protein